jgi:hypothetical protein
VQGTRSIVHRCETQFAADMCFKYIQQNSVTNSIHICKYSRTPFLLHTRKVLVSISAIGPALITEGFRGFPQSIQITKLDQNRFLLHTYQFINWFEVFTEVATKSTIFWYNNAVWSARSLPTFRRSILPPSSGSNTACFLVIGVLVTLSPWILR